jgi:hypothetical protein
MEVEGEPICADLYVAAGGEVLGLNGGWDEGWKKLSPPLLANLNTIEDAFARGDRRLNMGAGDQSHKVRFADGDAPISWNVVMPFAPRWALTRLRTAPMLTRTAARAAIKRNATPEQAERLRTLQQRVRGG